MKKRKQVWVSEQAYRAAKVASASKGMQLIDYFDTKLCDDVKKEKNKKRGAYGFLK